LAGLVTLAHIRRGARAETTMTSTSTAGPMGCIA
jgi:hypothetical protein